MVEYPTDASVRLRIIILAQVAILSMSDYNLNDMLKLAKALGLTKETMHIKTLPNSVSSQVKTLLFFAHLLGHDIDKPAQATRELDPRLEHFIHITFIVVCNSDTASGLISRCCVPSIDYPLEDGSTVIIMAATLAQWAGIIKSHLFRDVILTKEEIEIFCKFEIHINKMFPHVFKQYRKIQLTSSTFRLTHQ